MARNEELQEKELEVVEPENVHGVSSSLPPRRRQRSNQATAKHPGGGQLPGPPQ